MSPVFVSASLAAYPDLLNRYLVGKLSLSLRAERALVPAATIVAPQNFSERITWRQRLRGTVDNVDKSLADALAIGGLRNAVESVGRLHTVQAFGSKLGLELRALLMHNPAWIHTTCDLVGTTVLDARPPPAAILAVKSLLMTHLGCDGLDSSTLTRINSKLLGSWRKCSGDPDDQVELWLKDGARQVY